MLLVDTAKSIIAWLQKWDAEGVKFSAVAKVIEQILQARENSWPGKRMCPKETDSPDQGIDQTCGAFPVPSRN